MSDNELLWQAIAAVNWKVASLVAYFPAPFSGSLQTELDNANELLTPEIRVRLAIARDAARVEARDAAWVEAWVEARDAAWAAARYAARAAARDAASAAEKEWQGKHLLSMLRGDAL